MPGPTSPPFPNITKSDETRAKPIEIRPWEGVCESDFDPPVKYRSVGKLCPLLCPTQLENHGISSHWGTVDLAEVSSQRIDNIAIYHFIT
jgi:hypothetical protein